MIRPAQILVHPAWLLSLGVLVLNDHVLKAALHSPLTGKLSDFAGLVVAPALLAAVLGVRTLRGWWLAHLAVGAVFTALQLSPAVAGAWSALFAVLGLSWHTVCDPTDLLALPMLVVSAAGFRRALEPRPLRRGVMLLAGGTGLVASIATSPHGIPGAPWIQAEVFVHNATSDAVELHMRPLREGVVLDCEAVMADPAILPVELFDVTTVWEVWSGATLAAQHRWGEECQAVWLESAELEPVIVAWWASDYPERDFKGEYRQQREDLPAGGLRLERVDDGTLAIRDVEPRLTWAPRLSDDACPTAPVAERLAWDLMGDGEGVILEITEGADGCVALELDEGDAVKRRYLCGVDPLLRPFAAGDTITWSTERYTDAESVELLVTIPEGPGWSLYLGRNLGGPVELQGSRSDCGPTIEEACGTVAHALDTEVAIDGGAWTPLAHGTVTELGDDLVKVVAHERRIAHDPTCSDDASPTLVFELALLSPVSE